MSVWFAIPTAASAELAKHCLKAWRSQGYKIAIIREEKDDWPLPSDLCIRTSNYAGYARSVNTLAANVLALDPDCQVVVTAGDDVYPCMTKRADEIEAEFLDHFGGTLGVMQTQGNDGHHREADGSWTPDHVAWSPWLGREWCKRAYMGAGPFHPGFFHYWGAQNLHDVAIRLGLYWYRTDIIQWDDKWTNPDSSRKHLGRPPYIKKCKAKAPKDHDLYRLLRDQGYPGCGLL
jgi:hypothetical protein